MARFVPLKTIAYDTASLVPGQRELSFFHEVQGPAVDGTALLERELVGRIMNDVRLAEMLFDTLGLPPGTVGAREVVQPFLTSRDAKPGDIDLLLCAPNFPHRAVAIEWKRIKVRQGGGGRQRVNGESGLGRAIPQVNGLRQLAFCQTYLGIVVVCTDLSDRKLNFVFRGLGEREFADVVRLVDGLPLDPAVGVLYVELAQPSPDSVAKAGVVSMGVLRPANPVEQASDLTATIRNWCALRGA